MIKGQYRFICDECGEEELGEEWDEGSPFKLILKRVKPPHGWHTSDAGQYCPKHTVSIKVG